MIIFAIIISLCACQGQGASEDKTAKVVAAKPTGKKKESPRKVTIYRYGNFPMGSAHALCKELKKTFPEVVISDEVLTLPSEYYLKERNRYKGGGLLQDLKKHQHGDAVIGLTDQIIYQANNISPTYGIMGLSPIGTHTCVVSSKIPKNGRTQTTDNLVKLALHELGHAYGLPHCADEHCYMVDAEHKMKFPQTTDFCSKCRAKLDFNIVYSNTSSTSPSSTIQGDFRREISEACG